MPYRMLWPKLRRRDRVCGFGMARPHSPYHGSITNASRPQPRAAPLSEVLKPRGWHRFALPCLLLFLSACHESPTAPTPAKHPPTIRSLTCFPTSLVQGDSAIVVCNALDQDGDTLNYTWVGDGRLRLAGAPPGTVHVLTSPNNSQVIYYGPLGNPSDTAFVQCIVNDGHGGSVGAVVLVPLR